MVVYALQLVHDGTNVQNAFRQLYAHGFFYDANQCMAVHHRRKIVHAVGQSQCLRIGIRLAHLLYATMNVAEMWVDVFYFLTVEHRLKSQYTVC